MNGAFGWSFVIAVAGLGLSASEAAAETCTTDKDCMEAGTACGSEVCNHPPASDAATGACTAPVGGFSSYCTADTDCKCHALGATCVPAVFTDINYPPYCSFTTADGGGPVGLHQRPDSGPAPAPMDSGASAQDAGGNPVSSEDSGAPEPSADASDEASTAAPDASTGSGGSSSSSGCGCVIGASESYSWGVPAGLLGIALAIGRRRRPG
jgi:hypothetical protein